MPTNLLSFCLTTATPKINLSKIFPVMFLVFSSLENKVINICLLIFQVPKIYNYYFYYYLLLLLLLLLLLFIIIISIIISSCRCN